MVPSEVDTCKDCSKEYPSEMLYYDGVEPDVHSPQCSWCMIKELQERFGVDNVRLGNEN